MLLGTKEGCGEGCAERVRCWSTGGSARVSGTGGTRDGARVMTIEGIATDAALHPIQEAFVRHGAIQCGFWTPG